MTMLNTRRRMTQRVVVPAILITTAFPLTALAQKGGKGGDGTQDITACVTMAEPDLLHAGFMISDLLGSYCDSDRQITAFVGRRRTVTLALTDSNRQQRRILIHLGDRLPDVAGDPDPNSDGGGVYFQPSPGDWSEHPTVDFLNGVVGESIVAYIENLQEQGLPDLLPNPAVVSARIRFTDDQGRDWGLYWGDQFKSYGTTFVNTETTRGVEVSRRVDGNGTLLNAWDVVTLPDDNPSLPEGRLGKCAAFLWREWSNAEGGGNDYFGVFDVWFSWEVVGEP